jgi:exodeoxyribonuclease VII small subunit
MDELGTARCEDIVFEDGYEELKSIVARLNADDVSVHEMFEGFRRGKGLEQALRAYLAEREGELTEIEQGRNLPEFRVVAPSGSEKDVPAPPAGRAEKAPPATASEDDIPF